MTTAGRAAPRDAAPSPPAPPLSFTRRGARPPRRLGGYAGPILCGLLASLPFIWPGLSFLALAALLPLLIRAGGPDRLAATAAAPAPLELPRASPTGVRARLAAWLGPRALAGARFGALAGLVFGLAGTHWLAGVTVWGWLGLSLYLGLWWALFGLLLGFIRARLALPLSATAATLWTALEFLRARAFTGLPLLLYGHAVSEDVALIQIAELTGVYGVSFLLVFVNGVMAEMFYGLRVIVPSPLELKRDPQAAAQRCRQRLYRFSPWFSALLALVLFAVACSFGLSAIRRQARVEAAGPRLALLLVQPNRETRARAALTDAEALELFDQQAFERLLALTRAGLAARRAALGAAATGRPLVIWPESAVAGPLWDGGDAPLDRYRRLTDFCREQEIYLLFGCNTRDAAERLHNSVLLFAPDGRHLGSYDKVRLVPFGEYIPLGALLGWMRPITFDEGFAPGAPEQALLAVGGLARLPPPTGRPPASPVPDELRLGLSVCYEDIFAEPLRRATGGGADVLVNLSNDGWFLGPTEALLHDRAARFRAVEARRPLVRVGNVGPTRVIGRSGRPLAVVAGRAAPPDATARAVADALRAGEPLDVDEAGWLLAEVPLVAPTAAVTTFYVAHGDFFAGVCLGLALLLAGLALLATLRRPAPPNRRPGGDAGRPITVIDNGTGPRAARS